MEGSKLNPCTWDLDQLIFNKDANISQWGIAVSSVSGAEKTGHPYAPQKNAIRPSSHPVYKKTIPNGLLKT
jgi:hypothetical protein